MNETFTDIINKRVESLQLSNNISSTDVEHFFSEIWEASQEAFKLFAKVSKNYKILLGMNLDRGIFSNDTLDELSQNTIIEFFEVISDKEKLSKIKNATKLLLVIAERNVIDEIRKAETHKENAYRLPEDFDVPYEDDLKTEEELLKEEELREELLKPFEDYDKFEKAPKSSLEVWFFNPNDYSYHYVGSFDKAQTASEATGVSKSSVSNCLRKERLTTKGTWNFNKGDFIFLYSTDPLAKVFQAI